MACPVAQDFDAKEQDRMHRMLNHKDQHEKKSKSAVHVPEEFYELRSKALLISRAALN